MQEHTERYPVMFHHQRHEYGDIHTFIFERPKELIFKTGNFVHIRIPTVLAPDKQTRKLSIASAPDDTEIVFSTTVKSNSQWKKRFLELQAGDYVEVYKIKGYLETPPAGTLVMIAGGIGITPFRSIIRNHFHNPTSLELILIHLGREHYLYTDELLPLQFEQHRITREQSDETLSLMSVDHADATYMIAGAPAFVDDITKLLKEKGILEEKIQTDSFDGL